MNEFHINFMVVIGVIFIIFYNLHHRSYENDTFFFYLWKMNVLLDFSQEFCHIYHVNTIKFVFFLCDLQLLGRRITSYFRYFCEMIVNHLSVSAKKRRNRKEEQIQLLTQWSRNRISSFNNRN